MGLNTTEDQDDGRNSSNTPVALTPDTNTIPPHHPAAAAASTHTRASVHTPSLVRWVCGDRHASQPHAAHTQVLFCPPDNQNTRQTQPATSLRCVCAAAAELHPAHCVAAKTVDTAAPPAATYMQHAHIQPARTARLLFDCLYSSTACSNLPPLLLLPPIPTKFLLLLLLRHPSFLKHHTTPHHHNPLIQW